MGMNLKVAVLGCGPAGLIAAHAAANHPDVADVAVLSKKRKSPLYGAQYLHEPIPGLPDVDGILIKYGLVGEPRDYREKVYGRFFTGEVSPQVIKPAHLAWDIREAYDILWNWYGEGVNDVDLSPMDILEINHDYDLVINSVPLDFICHGGHKFDSQLVIAAGDAPELGINIGQFYKCEESTVICNGDPEVSWYRKSRIFGHTTVEWPINVGMVPINSAAHVRKPLYHNCDCYPDMVAVGRYGTWKKGVLSHEAFKGTVDAINGKAGR